MLRQNPCYKKGLVALREAVGGLDTAQKASVALHLRELYSKHPALADPIRTLSQDKLESICASLARPSLVDRFRDALVKEISRCTS